MLTPEERMMRTDLLNDLRARGYDDMELKLTDGEGHDFLVSYSAMKRLSAIDPEERACTCADGSDPGDHEPDCPLWREPTRSDT